MDESTVEDYIIGTFPGVETSTNFGYTFAETFTKIRPMLAEAYDIAVRRFTRRNKPN